MTTTKKRGRRIGAATAITVIGALAASVGPAIGADSGNTQSSIPSDGGAVKSGDVIVWKVDKTITLQPDPTTSQNDAAAAAAATPGAVASNSTTVCFPDDSRFNVTSVVAATKNTTATGNTGAAAAGAATDKTATAADTQIVSGHFSSDKAYELFHPWHFHALRGVKPPKWSDNSPRAPASQSPCGATVPMPAYDLTYNFTGDQLSKNDFYRQGFTWGGLVIPYKYYFTDHSIKSNSSVVAFVGYQGWFPGVSLAGIVALGPGTAPTASNSSQGTGGTSTSSTNSSVTALTYTVAVGFVASFGDSQTIKAGLMFGRDYQSNPASFPYENKTWMAATIGAGF